MDVHVDVDDATDSVPRRLHRMSEYDEGLFGFEKLDVYQRAVELLAVAARVIEGLPAGQHPIARTTRLPVVPPWNVLRSSMLAGSWDSQTPASSDRAGRS